MPRRKRAGGEGYVNRHDCDELEAIYGLPGEASTVKVDDRITPTYRVLIEKSPFAAPRTVIVITVGEIYFQCARAMPRASRGA
jgi:predicted pyridoxine 5'-phosphate oxidase superfamily flavin-nucleotide-binding protein